MNETLRDYLKWRGDITFEERPFNIIDNLVLCELSYLDLGPLTMDHVVGRTLRSCYDEIHRLNAYRLLTITGGHQDFIEACAHSARFGQLVIEQYDCETSPEQDLQFSAMTFRLNPDLLYVAYRGTDNTLVGWKEDFMMTFATLPSQRRALEYLEYTLLLQGEILVGGHSKGGNLAAYACGNLSVRAQSRIKHIYFNDAPGFCKDVVDHKILDRIEPKMTKIIPVYDVFGRLFEFDVRDTYIVKSTEKGIMQHDLISWCVDGLALDVAEKTDDAADYTATVLNQWVENATYEEREAFVNDVFAALGASGAKTFDELDKEGYQKVLESFLASSKEARDTALALPAIAAGELLKSMEAFFKDSIAKVHPIIKKK